MQGKFRDLAHIVGDKIGSEKGKVGAVWPFWWEQSATRDPGGFDPSSELFCNMHAVSLTDQLLDVGLNDFRREFCA